MATYSSYDSPNKSDTNCRTCTDFKTWSRKQREVTRTPPKKIEHKLLSNPKPTGTRSCPLDKDELGRNTWGLLHTIAANFPKNPTDSDKRDIKQFMDTLSRLYPCEYCARDFQRELREYPVNTTNQTKLSQWLCNLHNRVNQKLGKPNFDCSQVNERWRDGWKDGSCD